VKPPCNRIECQVADQLRPGLETVLAREDVLRVGQGKNMVRRQSR
jgi:hypothetical protein